MVISVFRTNRVLKLMRLRAPIDLDDASVNSLLINKIHPTTERAERKQKNHVKDYPSDRYLHLLSLSTAPNDNDKRELLLVLLSCPCVSPENRMNRSWRRKCHAQWRAPRTRVTPADKTERGGGTKGSSPVKKHDSADEVES
jgi:hypothetical protein